MSWLLAILAALTGASLLAATPASASSLIYQLDPGDDLLPGRVIASENGHYQLLMAQNGNLVLRYDDGYIIGDTGTFGHPGTIARMQRDGNFVLVAPGNVPIWSSNTAGHGGTVIQIQNDGAVDLYAPGHRFLRSVFPLDNNQYSVPTPRPGQPLPAKNAPGVSNNELGVAAWDGTRVFGCASAGKLVEAGGGTANAGFVEEQLCGMVTQGQPPKIDGYNGVRLSGSWIITRFGGGPWGAAASAFVDILTDATPAY